MQGQEEMCMYVCSVIYKLYHDGLGMRINLHVKSNTEVYAR